MIIFEGTVSHRAFGHLIAPKDHHAFDDIVFGLAKGAAITMFVYYVFKALLVWTVIYGGQLRLHKGRKMGIEYSLYRQAKLRRLIFLDWPHFNDVFYLK